MQQHAAEHPRALGTMLDLAIPDERDYKTIRRRRYLTAFRASRSRAARRSNEPTGRGEVI